MYTRRATRPENAHTVLFAEKNAPWGNGRGAAAERPATTRKGPEIKVERTIARV